MIIASAGVTHPLPAWLDALNPHGQLLLPMMAEDRWGGMLLVTRQWWLSTAEIDQRGSTR
jgi:protein-L-isoaspartate(D-aspartate) O-methyltransferase